MTQPPPPSPEQPPPRQGPRPLALHLMLAQAAWLSSLGALPLLKTGSPGWKPSAQLQAVADALASHPAEAVREAVAREVRSRYDALLRGLERYRHHPYRRDLPEPPVRWREGTTRLLDYGPAGGRPVLFVPSLVNRSYILDLSARHSLLRWLAEQGFRPLLVDWDWPGETERRFTLTDYIAGRLERALDAALALAGAALPVAGYCMGGLLVAALAQRRPLDVSACVMLATPWDFHSESAEQARRMAAALAPWMAVVAHWGALPVDGLQALFTGLDPLLAAKKFIRFLAFEPAGTKAEEFVALEDWLNDGVPLAAPVAEECITGWYGENTPASGRWRVAGVPVDPSDLTMPSLHLIPSRDRIVPPASARALAAAMSQADVLEPPLGHIGMAVGSGARERAWQPLAEWLAARR